jgi:sulfatase maturation enzyme AslB (radical SAM superfamily)
MPDSLKENQMRANEPLAGSTTTVAADEKDQLVLAQQQTIQELSSHLEFLTNDLKNTRIYFNQVSQEYSSLRKQSTTSRNWFYGLFGLKGANLSTVFRQIKPKRDNRQSRWAQRREAYAQIISCSEVYTGSPFTVILDLTTLCNLQCGMCFQSLVDKSGFVFGEMTDKSLVNSAGFAAKAHEVKLFATGEPFLSSNISTVVDALQGNVAEVVISTNGTIYNSGVKKVLKKISTLTVSFDSADPETFEKIRVRAKFARVVENLKKIRRDFPGLYLTFAVTVAKYNIDECHRILELAADLRVNLVQYARMRALDETMKSQELTDADRERILAAFDLVNSASIRTGVTFNWGL